MKNIHLLSTNKPSRLIIYSTLLNEFRLLDEPIEDWKHKGNLYITSNEEIKEGDWFYKNPCTIPIQKADSLTKKLQNESWNPVEYTKIILTTDPDLIKDGLQDIDDEFLEWFAKNPSCVEVKTYLVEICTNCGQQHCDNRECRGCPDLPRHLLSYPGNIEKKIITFCEGYVVEEEIITLKVELKQETIAEAGQAYLSKVADGKRTTGYADEDFTEGAKWQHQRSYIEEDMKTAFTQGHDSARLKGSYKLNGTFEEDWSKWIEQFRKK